MKIIVYFVLLFSLNSIVLFSQEQIKQWSRFEVSFKHQQKGNPFNKVILSANFSNKDTTFTVKGFYDGDSKFKLRFMPQWAGEWSYTTNSNVPELNNQKGNFICVPATDNMTLLKGLPFC